MIYDGCIDVMQAQAIQANQEERRFTAAVAAMQGILAGDTMHEISTSTAVAWAIETADALLKELER